VKQNLKKLLKRFLIGYMIVATVVLTAVPADVQGMFLPMSTNLTQDDSLPNRQQNLERLQRLLESKLISQRLSDLGFSQEDILPRLNQLSDQEVQFYASHLESLQTGGNLPVWLTTYGTISLAILLAFLVLALIVVMIAGVSTEGQDSHDRTDSDTMKPIQLSGGTE
jgi:hypothetical protein